MPRRGKLPIFKRKTRMNIEKEIRDLKKRVTALEEWQTKQNEKPKLVSKLGLSRRALNVLQRAGCDTIEDVIAYGPENLRSVYNCGERTFLEIQAAIGR